MSTYTRAKMLNSKIKTPHGVFQVWKQTELNYYLVRLLDESKDVETIPLPNGTCKLGNVDSNTHIAVTHPELIRIRNHPDTLHFKQTNPTTFSLKPRLKSKKSA